FDVAAVRPSSQARNGDEAKVETSPGSVTLRGVSLRFCVEWAYNVPTFQVDAPAWMRDAGFDIAAKAADPVNEDRLRLMMRTLLSARFGVKTHTDRREMQ